MKKRIKNCSSCETKYTIVWDFDEQDLEPLTCPFCGYEVEEEDEEVWTNENINENSNEDDNWN